MEGSVYLLKVFVAKRTRNLFTKGVTHKREKPFFYEKHFPLNKLVVLSPKSTSIK